VRNIYLPIGYVLTYLYILHSTPTRIIFFLYNFITNLKYITVTFWKLFFYVTLPYFQKCSKKAFDHERIWRRFFQKLVMPTKLFDIYVFNWVILLQWETLPPILEIYKPRPWKFKLLKIFWVKYLFKYNSYSEFETI
jgi:hypothetical protein